MNRIDRPAAIVLSRTITGLATIRALVQTGVEVHAIIFKPSDPVRFSRGCVKVDLSEKPLDDAALLDFLIGYSKKLGDRPVLFPTCDAHALLLAKHFEALDPYFRTSTTTYPEFLEIISKDGLYRRAAAAGVSTVPAITSPDLSEVSQWSSVNAGPYLLKPFYDGIPTSSLRTKNQVIPDREQLLAYVERHGTRSLIVQRLLSGGDGYVFDCYGYCDRDGRILTLASHRRWRQDPPDFGTTSYGEIPADRGTEAEIFSGSELLLGSVRYHGIFGIEWLQDRDTGRLHMIDFNARPFTTIGHLNACGLNLPALAYLELIGELKTPVERRPGLKRILWADLLSDMQSFVAKRKNRKIDFAQWLRSLLRCRSLAYPNWRDPGPGIFQLIVIAGRLLRFAFKTMRSR